jgi:hypothetical protein
MEITFADGTRIEVPASALDDFVRHDLKWVEFVHGRASERVNAVRATNSAPHIVSAAVKRCPSGSLHGC